MRAKPMLDKRTALAKHFLFGQLTKTELDQILALGVERRYTKGQVIFQQSEEGGSMMIVLRGQIKISVFSEDGKELILDIVPTGGCIGEIALLDGKGRTADATSLGDCILFIIHRRDFIPFLERHPQVAIRLLSILSERMRYADELVENIVFLNLPARLARLLLKLAGTYGVETGHGMHINLKLSQQDMGNLIATSRESVNRQLRLWQEEGLISRESQHIILIKKDILRTIAESDY
jgi:CRP-like cAMP-binding protein